ncbi:ARS binding protein 2 [Penicillium brevicompactum]|uniref:ARS binding protein 2 n=1 Tax=Penicillium brevicompactum TaxID=5074 RepID=A0A9W9RCV3_PENBR|nr:ARS binding protein 2 [Penicillium brevicompactum]
MFDPHRHHPMKDTADHADSRVLPSRDITEETIDDAYVSFILYCNPNVPSSVDTSELRKTFRCLPRSDGKSFNIFTLFGLIRRRLQNDEMKTWIQLAMELGVEPPCMEKKQSSQKVQQYTVRLKRWMRAMHIDAFFEYCLGMPHNYYTQLPPSGPFVGDPRDGVALEEDLALRALVPQWKPKRGRKRVEDRDEEDKIPKRPQLDTSVGGLHQSSFPSHSVTFPQSAIPFSAFPDDMESHDPWMTATTSFPNGNGQEQQGQDIRWRLPERDASPANYPQSAIVPRSHLPSDVLMSAEPQSAVTPSTGGKARARRRHGPAVSSAWPNSNGMSGGKSRGRPPNKGSSSGSFTTFQVNPSRESSQAPTTDTQSTPLVLDTHPPQPFQTPTYNQTPTPVVQGRPSKLQLQVPQHSGAPVRLATPPRLVVNGVNGAIIPGAGNETPNGSHHDGHNDTERNAIMPSKPSSLGHDNATNPPNPTIEDIVRALTEELIHARIVGHANTIHTDEAAALASAIVINVSSIYSQFQLGTPTLLLAFHLGIGHHFGFTGTQPGSLVIKVERAANPDGSRGPMANGHPAGSQYTVSHEYQASNSFSMQITLANINPGIGATGSSAHSNTVKAPLHAINRSVHAADLELDNDEFGEPATEATWKQRYTRLRAQMQKRDQSLSQYKRKIVESVMADI